MPLVRISDDKLSQCVFTLLGVRSSLMFDADESAGLLQFAAITKVMSITLILIKMLPPFASVNFEIDSQPVNQSILLRSSSKPSF